jgi:hypothetical protein
MADLRGDARVHKSARMDAPIVALYSGGMRCEAILRRLVASAVADAPAPNASRINHPCH